jgi:hypothetical protein
MEVKVRNRETGFEVKIPKVQQYEILFNTKFAGVGRKELDVAFLVFSLCFLSCFSTTKFTKDFTKDSIKGTRSFIRVLSVFFVFRNSGEEASSFIFM